jgi:hypothetical protein
MDDGGGEPGKGVAMFHKWHKRVLEEGAQAQGQVYGMTSYGTEGDFGVKVRVKMEDGSVQEFEKGPLEARHVGMLFEGSVVPVRYDPADTSKVVLDVPALEATQAGATAGRQEQLDAAFEHLGAGGGGAGASASGGAVAGEGALGGAGASGGADLLSQISAAATQGGGVVDLHDPNASPEDRVAKLRSLKDSGLLNEAQFEEAKSKLLGEGG